MLKVSFQGSLDRAYDLIDNRLVLQLSSLNIQRGSAPLTLKKNLICQEVADTIFYFEKQPASASLIIGTNVAYGGKPRSHNYGIALRQSKPDRFDLYVDSLGAAIKRGIRKKAYLRETLRKVLLPIFVVFSLVVLVFTPVGWIALLLLPILYPLWYFSAKREFNERQRVMRVILGQFETEFPTLEKLDTKDWITLAGRLKSAVRDVATPF